MRPARRRSRLGGLAALAALTMLVAGLPVLLYRLGGSPVPGRLPGWHQIGQALTRRDNGTLFLAAVRDVSWLAWAAFTASVVTELQAVIRRRAAPRLPLAGLQPAAARLVAMAVLGLTGTGAPLIAAQPIVAAQAATSHPVTADHPETAARDARAGQPERAASSDGPAAARYQLVTVRPGDCLWTIAARYLGDGDRYPLIASLNLGRDMGGGVVLSDPSLIWPGWVLRLPAGSGPADHDRAPADAGRHAGHRSSTPLFSRPHRAAGSSPTGSAPTPAPADSASPGRGPYRPGPRPAGERPADPRRSASPAADESTRELPALAVFAVGMLAGGALTSLGRMRHRQRQLRRPGRRIPLPAAAPVIEAEHRMRAAAEAFPANWLRAVLSDLGDGLISSGQAIPDIAALRVLPNAVEVLLASPPGEPPPSPFTVAAGHQGLAWLAPVHAADADPPSRVIRSGDLLPGLVTIGICDGGYLLADLEYLGVTLADGPPALVDRVLATAAAELATSTLAGWYDLILVGYPELADADARATCCSDLREALDLVAGRAVSLRRRLDAGDLASVRRNRLTDPGDEDWALTVVVARSAPSAAELGLLTDLAAIPGGLAALLPAAPADGGRDRADGAAALEIDYAADQPGGMVARIAPLGLRAYPQPLTDADYDAMTNLFAYAATETDVGPDEPPYDGGPWWPEAADEAAPPTEPDSDANWRPVSSPEDPDPAGRPGPASDLPAASPVLRIGVLGTLTINGEPGALLPAQSQLIVALALNGRDGLSNSQLCYLLGADPDHPRPTDSLRQLIVRTRRQLGPAGGGREWIEHLGGGHYALHPAARLDWHEFDAMTADGLRTRDARMLAAALRLIRGQPFTGCDYWWLDIALQETVRAQIVDAAEMLGDLALAGSDPAAAGRAARIGLAADSAAEQLWRVLMRAEHAAGNLAGVREVWARCLEVIGEIAPDGRPHPDTEALYRELLADASGSLSDLAKHAR